MLKRLITILTIAPLIFSAQKIDKNLINWCHSASGLNTNKAYQKVLDDKQSSPVIVAIIDSGVDVDHEDLQKNIWVNKGEIPGNNIDDDNNGYVDDINGWNFLGNFKGENINDVRLEVTRIYAQLKLKYDSIDIKEINPIDKPAYELYLEVKSKVETKIKYGKKQTDFTSSSLI